MGAQVPGSLGVALCRARKAQVAVVVPYRERRGQLMALSRAGESWRLDTSDSG